MFFRQKSADFSRERLNQRAGIKRFFAGAICNARAAAEINMLQRDAFGTQCTLSTLS